MIAVVLAAVALAQPAAPPDPLRIVRQVQEAVDRDGGHSLEREWRRTLAARPGAPDALLAVAAFERARYRFERSDSLLRRLDTHAGRDEGTWRAMAQVGMAQWRALGSEPQRAESLYVAARMSARSVQRVDIEAEAVLGVAQLRQRSQGPRVGQSLLAEWWALLPAPSPQDSAQRLCLMGAIDEQLGDTTGVRRITTGALLAERTRAWRVAGACRLAEAQSAERRGFFGGASVPARLALGHFARIRYDLGTALASQWLGYISVQRFRFREGEQLLEAAIVAARATRFASVEAWAHSGLAELHLALGDLRQARYHAAVAADGHESRGDTWGVANSRRFEGAALEASGDLTRAAARYADAQAAYVAAGLPLNALSSLTARAGVLLRLGMLDSAEYIIGTAAALGRTTEGAQSELQVMRAELAVRRGQLAAADSLLRSTTMSRDWRRGMTRATAVIVAAREARVSLLRNRIAAAESAMVAVAGALDLWRRKPQNTGYTASLAQLRDNWGGLGELYPDLVAQLASRGRIPMAFEFIERIRAREIVERSLRVSAMLADSNAAVRVLRSDRSAAPVVTLARLQSTLAADEAFVSFTLGIDDAPTTALVVTRDAAAFHTMPGRITLAPDIQRFVQLAATGTEATAASRRLGSVLLAPVLGTLPATVTRLIVSPDGELHRLPFDALRLPDGRFALERAAISVAPSATAMLALRALPPSSGTRLVAFGDPRYAAPRAPAAPVTAPARGGAPLFSTLELARLRHSGDEARRVGRYGTPGHVVLGNAASEAALMRTDWRDVNVLHFATHALVDPESQVGTALALSSGGGADGFVTPGEVALLNLRAPLVVLSACRSSGGQVLAGEGMRGLTAPLLGAGARAVVATHWSIGDRSVIPFVDRFYAALASGARVDDALRQAKLAAIRDGVSIADWGSYTVVGDGSMRVVLQRPALSPIAWLRNVTQSLRDTSGT